MLNISSCICKTFLIGPFSEALNGIHFLASVLLKSAKKKCGVGVFSWNKDNIDQVASSDVVDRRRKGETIVISLFEKLVWQIRPVTKILILNFEKEYRSQPRVRVFKQFSEISIDY